jgi:uncharacterized protein (TIGR00661 family)
MKILFGVQGTGNGHINRANTMAAALEKYPDLDVNWLLSGRNPELGCGDIQDYSWREGLTFAVKKGKINLLATLKKNNLRQFFKDIKTLDLQPYDLVITDYEPVIAHAARKRGIRVVGIGNQYAFKYPIPMRGTNPFSLALMNNFSPATTSVGLHWHHFGQPILPPILNIKKLETYQPNIPNKHIVYLPFENLEFITELLRTFVEFDFYIYHPEAQEIDFGNLHYRPISRNGFKQNLLNACGVITNCGFELISECLYLGKRIYCKPIMGQMEQLSNAAALTQLGYAEVSFKLSRAEISAWLHHPTSATKLDYPDVAQALAGWIVDGCKESTASMATRLWGTNAN